VNAATVELPLCGHTKTWRLSPDHPVVCQLCHPRPGTTAPWPRGAPQPPPFEYRESKLDPSPWRHELNAGESGTTPTGGHMETKQETASGWFWPTTARKAHADPGTGTALCGKWGRHGLGGSAPIEEPLDAPPSPSDCVACRRRVDALAEGR
jgi:hypothetical protein